MVNETNQPYVYVGDDPVNGVDRNGDGGYGAYWDEQWASSSADYCHQFSGDCQWGSIPWRGIVQVAIYATGVIAIATCTVATEGLCGLVVGAAEFPIGSFIGGGLIGGGEGLVHYASESTCHTGSGYLQAIEDGSVIGIGEGAVDELIPATGGAPGVHQLPAGWLDTLLHYWIPAH
jgi:hypothetical protein